MKEFDLLEAANAASDTAKRANFIAHECVKMDGSALSPKRLEKIGANLQAMQLDMQALEHRVAALLAEAK